MRLGDPREIVSDWHVVSEEGRMLVQGARVTLLERLPGARVRVQWGSEIVTVPAHAFPALAGKVTP